MMVVIVVVIVVIIVVILGIPILIIITNCSGNYGAAGRAGRFFHQATSGLEKGRVMFMPKRRQGRITTNSSY